MKQLPHPSNLAFVEELLAEYLVNPASVPAEWQTYFQTLQSSEHPAVRLSRPGPTFTAGTLFNPDSNDRARGANGYRGANGARGAQIDGVDWKQDRLDQLIRAYRLNGHAVAQIDPLGLRRPHHPELDPLNYGFTDADLDREFSARTIAGPRVRTLREIVQLLQNTYCGAIGVQFMHIDNLELRHWLQERMEGSENRVRLSRTEQHAILTRLTEAVILEEFIQLKFLGAKSFSLEGAESLIPLLYLMIERAASHEIDEIVLGMAHRGRLNVLANIMGKHPRRIFREFADLDYASNLGRGDVKYHLGYQTDFLTSSGRSVHLALCFNPSHLEYVNPVALGRLRAKQDRFNDPQRQRGLGVMIHGDAAFAGEGIVQETLNLSGLPGYETGGSIHIIVNNQIGFTTGPEQGRSTEYCTDVAKMLQSPIFHVNGENPEAVAQVVHLAMEFRQTFHRDVFIDMYCFRRRGHNETDEPAFTQPIMYRAIKERPSVQANYLNHLVKLEDGVTADTGEEIRSQLKQRLELEFAGVSEAPQAPESQSPIAALWRAYRGGADAETPEVDTHIPAALAAELLRKQAELPADFHPHPKASRLLDDRLEMSRGERPLPWAAGESLALGSLAVQGHRVRLSGQDCERGTFSHRHAVLHDVQDGKRFMPLAHLSPTQAPLEIVNSPLSESAVLGFEYGYSIATPDGLVMWEAQFGDFVNVAQVIIDQFICSAEDKWHRLSGLTLLLPHGFEGEGPEHSSARLERFLMESAEDNIQVLNLTTPAQYFHALRRQVLRPWRKPLIIMTPKSLLRHPAAVSSLDDITQGRFQRIIGDTACDPKKVRRVLLCSGKVYYELLEERKTLGRDDIALVRVEQLYPLCASQLMESLAPYAEGTDVRWVQEEPENMGAWYFIRMRFGDALSGRFRFSGISRKASASPATGSKGSHKLEQKALLKAALEG